jgi:hypothetical protein
MTACREGRRCGETVGGARAAAPAQTLEAGKASATGLTAPHFDKIFLLLCLPIIHFNNGTTEYVLGTGRTPAPSRFDICLRA